MDSETAGGGATQRGARLMDQVRVVAGERGLRARTVKTYRSWIVRYVRYCGLRHPSELGTRDVERFLEWLASERRVGASTLGQARAALSFLYRDVLAEPERCRVRAIARGAVTVPHAISPDEAERLLAALSGRNRLAASLMYGAGLRLTECIGLRVNDVDVRRRRVHVYDADRRRRVVALPMTLLEPMDRQIERVRRQHFLDVRRGGGWVVVRRATEESGTFAVRQWRSSWLFPASRQHKDRATGQWRRHHVSATTVQRAIAAAAHGAGIAERVTARTLRHSCAMQLLRSGFDVEIVRGLLGHRDLSTTLRLLGGMERRPAVRSPLDQLSKPPRARGAPFADARRAMD
jgi:site-specific recombinase XerD